MALTRHSQVSSALCAGASMNENHVAIKFFGFDSSPEELSALLGLQPTKTALKGDVYGKLKKTYPWNLWEYRWIRNEQRFIGDLAEEFIATVVEPRKETIKQLLARCSGELSVVQYLREGCNPGFHLGHAALSTLCNIEVELDLDIYCLAEDG